MKPKKTSESKSPKGRSEWKRPTRKSKRGCKNSGAPAESGVGWTSGDDNIREKENGWELALATVEGVPPIDQNAERLDNLRRIGDAWNCSPRKQKKYKCGIDEVLGIEWNPKGKHEDKEDGEIVEDNDMERSGGLEGPGSDWRGERLGRD